MTLYNEAYFEELRRNTPPHENTKKSRNESQRVAANGNGTNHENPNSCAEESRKSQESQAGDSAKRTPDPLQREIPPAAPYPMDALGPFLGSAARRIQQVVQAPDAICAQSVLSGATLATQALKDVTLDGRTYPLSDYFASMAASGERKTETDRRALWPHRQYERKLVEMYDNERFDYENQCDAYKRQREIIIREKKDQTARENSLKELGDSPKAPLEPLLTVGEPTYEGIVRLLFSGRPSIGLFTNEGGRLIGGHGMNGDNQLKTAAGLSELWDGQRIDRSRGGEGSLVLYGRRLSMHVMVQPGVARLLLDNALLNEQGITSRLLVAYPETTAGTRWYVESDLSQDPAIYKYNKAITDLLEHSLRLAPGKRNELAPPPLTLSIDAKHSWVIFHDHVERQLRPGGELESVRPFGSKAAEHVLRLSGTLTLIDNPDACEITKSAIDAGVELVEFYITEALRLCSSAAINPELAQAEKLLVWAQSLEKPYVYLRKIYRFGPNSIRDAKTAKRLIAILEEHGWLTRVEGGMMLDEVFHKDVWEVYRDA